jgi:hypothetical protein
VGGVVRRGVEYGSEREGLDECGDEVVEVALEWAEVLDPGDERVDSSAGLRTRSAELVTPPVMGMEMDALGRLDSLG